MTTPFEALEFACHYFQHVDRWTERGSGNTRPGEVIAHLPPEKRAALEQLTSATALRVRPEWAALHITKVGFCEHGWRYSERCVKCGRTW